MDSVKIKDKITLNSKLHIIISILGIIFLVWVIMTKYESIIPEFIDYPKLDNSKVEITSIELNGNTYEYARTLNESPTLGELLDAQGLAGVINENASKAKLSRSAASGEERNEIILDSEKRLKPIKLLQEYINHLKEASVIINYTYSDNSIETVFNNRLNEEVKESFDGKSSIMNANGKLFSIEDNGVYTQNSISNVDVLMNVLKEAVENPSAVEFKAVDAGGGYISYQITFNTIEDFVNIYTNLTEEDKTMMITSIKDEISKQSKNGETNGKVCFEFIAGNDWSLNVYNTVIIDNVHVLNWYFQGFYETFDWSLDTQLYSERLEDQKVVSISQESVKHIENLMSDYTKVEIDYNTGEMQIIDKDGNQG